jgi:hypothetical protein
MSSRGNFTADEWQTLQFAPLWVFSAVASADDDIDKKELNALAEELKDAPLFKNPLARDVLISVATNFGSIMEAYRRDSRDILRGLRDVAAVLAAKESPDTAQGFKRAMLLIGKNVAEASRGGLFGPKISKEEKAAIALVAAALDL